MTVNVLWVIVFLLCVDVLMWPIIFVPDQVVNNLPKDVSQNFSESITENFYKAPYARATSLEDPTVSNLEYSAGSRMQSELAPFPTESIKPRVKFSDSTLIDQSNDSIEKPRSKESKGFRKLLKFGRRSHSSASGEANGDSDGSVTDDQTEAASSNDGKIVVRLISNHAGTNFHEMVMHQFEHIELKMSKDLTTTPKP